MSDVLERCSVCGGLLDEEDLFCANCGLEAPHHQHLAAPAARLSTHNFQCRGCGASMSYDASAQALRCPFCGSTRLDGQSDAHEIAPQFVVPFVLRQDEAIACMRRWLGEGFWRPGDLSQQAMVVAMTPVYVPFWVFEANTHTYWTADSSHTPPGARGDWVPMFGEHRQRHAGLLVGASSVLTPAEISAIHPFDLDRAVPPDQVDLDNITFERFAVPRKYARPLARQGLEALEAQACAARYVPGQCRNMKVNVRITDMASRPTLLPVWIMAYQYGGQVFRFLVNGQTGRATGQAPTSWRKMAAAVALLLAIVLLVLLVFAGLARGAAIARGCEGQTDRLRRSAWQTPFMPPRGFC